MKRYVYSMSVSDMQEAVMAWLLKHDKITPRQNKKYAVAMKVNSNERRHVTDVAVTVEER